MLYLCHYPAKPPTYHWYLPLTLATIIRYAASSSFLTSDLTVLKQSHPSANIEDLLTIIAMHRSIDPRGKHRQFHSLHNLQERINAATCTFRYPSTHS